MGHIATSELSYAHPGGEMLFFDASFSISPGEKVGLIGDNGVGKTTLFRLLTGEITPDEGQVSVGGQVLAMAQDVGLGERQTIRELLLTTAPTLLRRIGCRMTAAERRMAGGDDDAAIDLATAIGEWGDHGGYELESRWDSAIQQILRSRLDDVGERDCATLSGGERKHLVLELLFTSDADVLLLDEPDNYLDIPAKQWMEDRVQESDKTILMISHDRDTLTRSISKIVTLESSGCWVHGGSYATYPEARRQRQAKLGDDLQRWKEEERRLYQHLKIMKQRAALNDKNASKADAAEQRWKRFVAAGAPAPPAREQKLVMRLRGSQSGRRALQIESLRLPGLIKDFSDELRFGERLGLIGPNGSGKTSLLRLLMGEDGIEHSGRVTFGSRVMPGIFTQVSDRPDFTDRTILEIVNATVGDEQRSMAALARYELQGAARRLFATLSGGQKARLEILALELRGHNLLLLDEPTDHLDLDSSEALETALESFEGSVVAVSHDRAFLRRMDRYLMITHDGAVFDIPEYDLAIEALLHPEGVAAVKRIRPLSA